MISSRSNANTVYAKATWLFSRWQSLRLGANKVVALATSRPLPIPCYVAWVHFKGSEIALPNLRATESYIPNAGCATCFIGTPAIHSRIHYCTGECLRFGCMAKRSWTMSCHLNYYQSPPSIPTLAIVQFVTRHQKSKLIIDWHNLGYSILAMKLGEQHRFVRVAKW